MQRKQSEGKREQRRRAEELEARLAPLLLTQSFTAAIELIVANLGPELRGYFRAVSSSVVDGDDLYQNACLAIWQGLPKFQAQSTVRTWVYGIAHNLYWQWLRDYWRKHAEHLATLEEDRIPAPSLSSQIRDAENRLLLADLREQMTAAELEIYILHAERGFEFTDIAKLLAISEATVRQRYHRAKERLKKALHALKES